MAPVDGDTPKSGSKFPFKTLIWAAFALIAMFIFRKDISDLLSSASEIAVFGIELKVGKEQAAELESAIKEYEDRIDGFSEQVAVQRERIQSLEGLKDQLEEDIANCPKAATSAANFNLQFSEIMKSSNELKVDSDVLKDTRIIERLDRGRQINQMQ